MYSANVLDELPVISGLRRYILYVPRSTAYIILSMACCFIYLRFILFNKLHPPSYSRFQVLTQSLHICLLFRYRRPHNDGIN